ncbi:MAG TPA: hypothetical protein VFC51_18420 [Chloroflexota bacterium]|nr:hypothetical protein [Chloroflexota bacterium]
MLRRSAESPVLADFWVFPGGTVRPDDGDPENATVSPCFTPNDAHAALARPPDSPAPTPAESFALYVAAFREVIEETGIVLASDPSAACAESCNGSPSAAVTQIVARRREIERGVPLHRIAVEHGAQLDLGCLTYYAHWITPEPVPQRFDTRFFLAAVSPDTLATPSEREMAEGMWIDVESALALHARGSLALHFATIQHLRRLEPFRSVASVLHFARTKPIAPVMPTIREIDGRTIPQVPVELSDAW